MKNQTCFLYQNSQNCSTIFNGAYFQGNMLNCNLAAGTGNASIISCFGGGGGWAGTDGHGLVIIFPSQANSSKG